MYIRDDSYIKYDRSVW